MVEIHGHGIVLYEGNESAEAMTLVVLQGHHSALVDIARVELSVNLEHAAGHLLSALGGIGSVGLLHAEGEVEGCVLLQRSYLILEVIERHAQTREELKRSLACGLLHHFGLIALGLCIELVGHADVLVVVFCCHILLLSIGFATLLMPLPACRRALCPPASPAAEHREQGAA